MEEHTMKAESYDLCVDRIPPEIKPAVALADRRLAIEERASTAGRGEAATDVRKLWAVGATLRVRFLDGTDKMKSTVETIAKTWEEHGNFNFQFGNFADSEIRLTFQHQTLPGYWSLLGTAARDFPNQATMSLTNGWDDNFMDTEITRVRRTVLHEFGHALGLVHEHQSPPAGIPWDEPKVIAWYQANQNWDEAETRQQVLDRYTDEPWIAYTEHDPDSIMQYPVEQELTIGDFAIGWNDDLSETDKAAIGLLYPA
jgi:hypothetical protein